jgi:MFS family permease
VDGLASAGAILLFSFSLWLSNLALPLVALAAGYSATEIGILTAVSALAQLGVRATIPALARRFPDRTLVSGSSGLLAAACALVALSTAVVPFVVAELLQGAARGYFWSGSQLHGVRTGGSAIRAIAKVNLLSSVGLVAGPLTAGVLAGRSDRAGLLIGAGAAVLATGCALLMTRLPTLTSPDRARSERLWRRPAVVRGSLASAGGGAFTALIMSYLPVLLAAEQSAVVVGVLVAIANAAHTLSSAAIGMVPPARVDRWLIACTVANGIGLAVVAPAAGSIPLAVAALVLCGCGSGALLTMGPAVATDAVREDERAAAIAVTGVSRAAALMATPLAVAAAVTLIPLSAAVSLVGLALAVPFRARAD